MLKAKRGDAEAGEGAAEMGGPLIYTSAFLSATSAISAFRLGNGFCGTAKWSAEFIPRV